MQYRMNLIGIATIAILSATLAGADAPADDVTIVTATRTSVPLDQVASSVTVITAKQLEASHQTFLVDALKDVPGLYMNRSGGPGNLVDIYLRGSATGDTLVLIDGVPVNDPSSPDHSYDPTNLTVANVERVEVLRGAQSTLYGADAMAGVINIITKRGHGKPKTSLTLGGGRYGTGEGRLDASGSSKAWAYSASASQFATAGFPLGDLQAGNTHNDGYRNTTLSARVDGKLSDTFKVDAVGRYINGRSNYADFPVDHAVDNGVHRYESEQLTGRLEGRWQPASGKWEHIFGVSSNSMNRDYLDQVTGSPASTGNYNGKTLKFDYQGNFAVSNANTLTIGAERLRDESHFTSPWDSAPTTHIFSNAYYAQDQLTLAPRWLATAGVRVDDHESFGTKATYRLTSTYALSPGGTRVKATYATGFKAPSLYQLYDPLFGNAKLKPETSETYDVGVEQTVLAGRGIVGATYFHNNFKDLIDWSTAVVPTGAYLNVSSASTHGVEVIASYKAAAKWKVDIGYTWTHTENAAGKPLARRPGTLYTGSVNYQATSKLNIDLTGQYVGDRIDTAPFPSSVLMPNYALFNLAGTYVISPEYRAFLRVDNLFDKKYEDVYSYATPRRGLYGGLTVRF